jgi:hypothetical protein
MLSPHQIIRLNDLYRGFKIVELNENISFPKETLNILNSIAQTQKTIYFTKDNLLGTAISMTITMNHLQEKEKLIMWEFIGHFDEDPNGMWIQFLDIRGRQYKVFIEPGDTR